MTALRPTTQAVKNDELMQDRADRLTSGHRVVIIHMTEGERDDEAVRDALRALGVTEEQLKLLRFE